MTGWPLRFLHASDWHLEQPLYGISEIPEGLRERAVEAPFRAAEKVIDAAIEAAVDFLVLSGDIVDVNLTGPRGIVFLREQFARLAEREIPVYWSPGRVDAVGNWPTGIPMPKGVQFFSGDRGEQIVHRREDEPIARLVGLGHDAHGRIQADVVSGGVNELFSIGIGHGHLERTTLEKSRLGYVALGGPHERDVINGPPRAAQYAGTHQGRCPGESGAHGATLVEVDDLGNVRTKFVATDVLRWLDKTVVVDERVTIDRVQNKLTEALRAVQQGAEGRDSLVRWRVEVPTEVSRQLRRRQAIDDLVSWLREGVGGSPVVYTVSIEIDAAEPIPSEWYEEETILGDYLRLARELEANAHQPLDLAEFIGASDQEGIMAGAAKIKSPEARRQVLQGAVRLGADLLAAEPSGQS